MRKISMEARTLISLSLRVSECTPLLSRGFIILFGTPIKPRDTEVEREEGEETQVRGRKGERGERERDGACLEGRSEEEEEVEEEEGYD
jgi:hypothetical protein